MTVQLCRQERLKTEKLLSSLLPPAILKQMKNGEVPAPEVDKNRSQIPQLGSGNLTNKIATSIQKL